jgi:hypothetical protein
MECVRAGLDAGLRGSLGAKRVTSEWESVALECGGGPPSERKARRSLGR